MKPLWKAPHRRAGNFAIGPLKFLLCLLVAKTFQSDRGLPDVLGPLRSEEIYPPEAQARPVGSSAQREVQHADRGGFRSFLGSQVVAGR